MRALAFVISDVIVMVEDGARDADVEVVVRGWACTRSADIELVSTGRSAHWALIDW